MLNVCCVNSANYLGRGVEYVNTLFDSVRRNLTEGTPGRFIVFTDGDETYADGIEVHKLPGTFHGWWNKLWLFSDEAFDAGDRVLYFDLDTLIVGPIDELAAYTGNFAILADFYRPNGWQSSVMAWEAGTMGSVWSDWTRAGRPAIPGGDQAWIERSKLTATLWQDVLPGVFCSFKRHCNPYPPEGAKVVVFHGEPRPHECNEEWVRMTWKVGGGSAKELRAVCNTANEALIANVRSAIARGLPWLAMAQAHEGHAVVIGGGPSLADTLDDVKRRHDAGQTVFATNGTAATLHAAGIVPEYHVVVDARPENAAFVAGSLLDTEYLIASQCDTAVFEALENAKVTLFHTVNDFVVPLVQGDPRPTHLIGGGSTVGLKSIAAAYVMGYRKFHLYGFDSSYRDDAHHAYAQPLNDNERIMDAVAAGKSFRCAPWMIGQAEEFQTLALDLAELGCITTVHGDGLIPHLALNLAMNPPRNAADERASEILKRVEAVKAPVGAEIGVFTGALSSRLLTREDLTLYMVDSWAKASAESEYAKSGDFHAGLSQFQQDAYAERAHTVTRFANGRAKVLRMDSRSAAANVADGSLDFVFIDADHSYEGCRADIEAWQRKVKVGGWLCGHDYENTAFAGFGVTRAVDEFAESVGVKPELGDNFTWFIQRGNDGNYRRSA